MFTSTRQPTYLLSQSLSAYAQDVWKARPRLTVTYGLRWELAPAPSPRNNTILAAWTNVDDPAATALAPAGTPLWATTYANFAPRAGLAWSPGKKGLVFRAGVGLFYDLGVGSVADVGSFFPGDASVVIPSVSVPVGSPDQYLPTLSLQPPYPVVEAFSPTLRLPRSWEWNTAIEKSIGDRQVVTGTYVGQHGDSLLRQQAQYQPNPNFASDFLLTGNTAWSNYNALQLQYRRPFSGGLQALVGYTWSHSLDNASDDVIAGFSGNVISAASDYASSSSDVRSSLSGALTYSIPGVRSSGILGRATRNWSVAGVLVARTGFPFNAVVELMSPDPGGYALSRPDRVPGVPLWISDPTAGGGKSLNAGAFVVPSNPRQGTEGRNDIPGFGLTQVDLSTARKFQFTDRVALQFRADAFNAPNHPNFTNPPAFVEFGPANLVSQEMLDVGLGDSTLSSRRAVRDRSNSRSSSISNLFIPFASLIGVAVLLFRCLLLRLCLVVLLTSVIVDSHGQSTRRFNVSDDIGLTYFGDPFLDKAEAISFSPDDRYFVVHAERGRLDINRPESTLRVYNSDEVRRFLVQARQLPAPAPIWTFSRATYKDGPVISTLRWLPDSSGFGFLATSPAGTVQLFLGDIRSKRILLLTPPNQDITAFDIRDARHYVYTALSPEIREQVRNENDAASVVGTDRKLTGLLSPVTAVRWHDLSELWAVIGGSRKRIEDLSRHRPLAVHWRGQMALALSPDGRTLLTALTVPYVPSSWTTLYAPPYATDKHHIEPGKQDPDAFDGWIDVSHYVLIDLRTDAIEPLPLGPFGYEADWIGLPYTDWSKDSTAVALTDTFLDRETAATHDQPIRPCAVVVSLRDKRVNCVEPVMGDLENGEHEPGFHEVNGIRFDGPGDDRIVLQYNAGLTSGRSYRRSSEGWTADSEGKPNSRRRLDVAVKEGLNDPPILLATDLASMNSRVLWDPNRG